MTRSTFIVGDTETTGLVEPIGVVEIGWIPLNADGTADGAMVASLIDPSLPIEASASGVHNITANDVAGSPTLEEFVSEAHESCYGRRLPSTTVLVAHNAKFDSKFFAKIVDGAPSTIPTICTYRLARHIWPDAPNHKLGTLRYWLGLEVDVPAGSAHRVDADIQVCAALLRRILAHYQATTPGVTLDHLATLCHGPLRMHKAPFGKHVGMSYHDIPDSYLRWMLSLDDLDADDRHTIQTLRNSGARA